MRGEEDKQIVLTRNPYKRERIGTVDLLISTCSDWALLILKNIIFFFTKQTILMRRSSVLSLPLQQGFPGLNNKGQVPEAIAQW